MSKWLERLSVQNKAKIKARVNKLQAEYDEYRRNYNDFPYDRYLHAMERRKAEIEELELYGTPETAQKEVDDWKERVKQLESYLGKCKILASNIEPEDAKSNHNLQRILMITNDFLYYDEEFKERCEKGLW